eukprot:TRINITY_DN11877_c0_g1_i1.p1 TRINITY_DN11877_c0_g1~~TRINITY_DN11877_c0_g1_i1.p1  ORF type:complete len:229 (-),score=32.97 TRINITY_DN11877_c0_g1_i1:84-770(-)
MSVYFCITLLLLSHLGAVRVSCRVDPGTVTEYDANVATKDPEVLKILAAALEIIEDKDENKEFKIEDWKLFKINRYATQTVVSGLIHIMSAVLVLSNGETKEKILLNFKLLQKTQPKDEGEQYHLLEYSIYQDPKNYFTFNALLKPSLESILRRNLRQGTSALSPNILRVVQKSSSEIDLWKVYFKLKDEYFKTQIIQERTNEAKTTIFSHRSLSFFKIIEMLSLIHI